MGSLSRQVTVVRRLQFRIITLLILMAVVAGCIGIYFKLFGPGEVSIRTAAGETIIQHEDFVAVDWDSQEYELRDGLKSELHDMLAPYGLVGGLPFELCVDDRAMYRGRMTSSLSSFAFEGLAIDLMPKSESDNKIHIEWSYPASTRKRQKEDPRFRHRVYNSFWSAGKLITQDNQ